MVTRNPDDDELTGFSSNDDLSDGDFSYVPNHSDDTDEKALAVVYFYRLYQLYAKYSTKTPEYVSTHIGQDINKLKVQLLKTTSKDLERYVAQIREDKLAEYKLEKGIKEAQIDIKATNDVLNSTITTVLDQLKNDVKTKVQVWIDRNNPIKDFNLKPNFKRAISRFNQGFRYATNTLTQKVSRTVKKFVYQEDLWLWVCYGRHPCAWCIDQSKNKPRPLSDIPYDHIGGYCDVENVKGDYSQEYLNYVGDDID